MKVILDMNKQGVYFDKAVGDLAANTPALGPYEDARETGMDRYLVLVGPDAADEEDTEEIDVDAQGEKHARQIAELAIARDYQPGIKIVKVIRD